MEAVQQKVILSQKKEEMEMTMDMFLQDQLKNRLDSAAHRQSETTSDSDCGKDTLLSKLSRPFRALLRR